MGGPHHMLVPGVVPLQEQDFGLFLVELHEVPLGPFVQPVKVPLDLGLWDQGSMALRLVVLPR